MYFFYGRFTQSSKDSASRMQRACSLLRRSLFSRVIYTNRPQRYCFLRTQQNKMHKISEYVHKNVDLCNPFYLNLFCPLLVFLYLCSHDRQGNG